MSTAPWSPPLVQTGLDFVSSFDACVIQCRVTHSPAGCCFRTGLEQCPGVKGSCSLHAVPASSRELHASEPPISVFFSFLSLCGSMRASRYSLSLGQRCWQGGCRQGTWSGLQFCRSHPFFIPRVSPGKVPSPSRGACPGFGSASCSPEPGEAPLPPHLSCAAQSEQAVRLSQCFLIKALGVI